MRQEKDKPYIYLGDFLLMNMLFTSERRWLGLR